MEHKDWKDRSITDWRATFMDIYGQQSHVLTLEAIGFHFLEEAGEELSAIRSLLQLRGAKDQVAGLDAHFLEELTSVQGIVEQYQKHCSCFEDDERVDHASNEARMVRARLVKAKKDLVIEFADTFSWFCSVLNKVRLISRNCRQECCQYADEDDDFFEHRLIDKYMPNGRPECPTCHKCPCECVFFESPPECSDTAPSAVEG